MFKFKDVTYQHFINIKEMDIPGNQINFLVGDSGTGKTTILKMLAKLISPTTGTIYYHQQPLEDIDPIEHRKKIILLPQKAHIFKQTIKDNLIIGLKYHNKSYTENDLINILKEVQLNKKLDDDASLLSGGEQQRLALARILLLDADVYLLDEPSSSLDQFSEKLIIKVVVEYIKKTNKTLIMVTHNLDIANEYADHVIRLDGMKKEVS
jgi:putative ABC transport system ATP-binding protein